MNLLMTSVAVAVCGNLLQDKKKETIAQSLANNSRVPSQKQDNDSSQCTFLVSDSFTYILVYKSVPNLPDRVLDCVTNLPSAMSMRC